MHALSIISFAAICGFLAGYMRTKYNQRPTDERDEHEDGI
jgi:hypothetical protein